MPAGCGVGLSRRLVPSAGGCGRGFSDIVATAGRTESYVALVIPRSATTATSYSFGLMRGNRPCFGLGTRPPAAQLHRAFSEGSSASATLQVHGPRTAAVYLPPLDGFGGLQNSSYGFWLLPSLKRDFPMCPASWNHSLPALVRSWLAQGRSCCQSR